MTGTIASGSIRIDGDVSDVSAKINTVNKSIDNLGKTAKKAGAEASAGLNKIGSGGSLARAERQTNSLKNAIERATAAAKAGGKGTADYYRALANARGVDSAALEPYIRNLELAQKKASGLTNAFSTAGVAIKGYIAALGVRDIIRMSDDYTQFTAQLKLATRGTQEYATAYKDVKRIATEAQADLSAVGILYARIATGTRELGISQQKVADINEVVNLSLKVSGATAEESASATLQLSQAFASGALRGEEFNAVNEAAPRLMKALADGMGVAQGSLKDLASEGKITSEVMANVLPKALEQLRKEAKSIDTIGGSFVLLKNEIFELVGTGAEISGFSRVVSGGLKLIANNLTTVASIVGTLALAKFVSSLATMASGLRVVAAGAEAAGIALHASLGPIGLITAGLGLATMALVAYGRSSKTAADQNVIDLSKMKMGVEELVEEYRKLNELQREQFINVKIEDLDSARQDVQKSVQDMVDALEPSMAKGAKGAAKFRAEFSKELSGIVADTGKTKQELVQAIGDLVNKYAPLGKVSADYRAEMVALAAKIVENKGNVNTLSNELESLKKVTQEVTAASSELANIQPPAGMEKWDEYLASLTAARDMIGMNARELGEFKAAQAGANDIQKEMAGIVSAEADEYTNLQNAIKDKQKDAANAAIENIRNLDLERQRVALLAQQMASVMAAARAFAQGNVSADVQAGVYASINEAYATYATALSVSAETEKQIARIQKNTVPGSKASKKSGGGGAKSDPAGDYLKQLNEQIALIGKQTEYEKALANIQLGKYGALSQYQKDDILGKAQTLDLLKQAQEETEKYQAFIEEITGEARLKEHEQQIQWLTRAWNEGRIGAEEYKKYVDELTAEYNESFTEMSEFAKEASANIQNQLGDTLEKALSGNMDGILDDWLKMLQKMVAQAIATDLNQALFGKGVTGSGDLLGGLLGGIGSLFGGSALGGASASSPYMPAGGWGTFTGAGSFFADGGYTGPGGKYDPAGIVHRGEVVWSQDDVRRHGGVSRVEAMRLRGYSSGGIVGGGSASLAKPQPIIHQTFNITTPDADSFRKSQSQIERSMMISANRQMARA